MSDFLAKLREAAAAQAKKLEAQGAVAPPVPKPEAGPPVAPPTPAAPVAPVTAEPPAAPPPATTSAPPAPPAQTMRPAGLGGLKLPGVRPATIGGAAPVQPAWQIGGGLQPAQAPATPAAQPAAPEPAKPAGLVLGAALQRLVSGDYARSTNITAAARTATVPPPGYEPSYSAEDFMLDWENLERAGGPTPDEQAAVFRKAVARIRQIFTHELEGLTIAQASTKAITDLSAMVNLTFLRVKDAPSAWAMLDRVDKSAVIEAQRIMARKRNSVVKSNGKKAAAEISASFAETTAIASGFTDEDLGLDGLDFDLGGM